MKHKKSTIAALWHRMYRIGNVRVTLHRGLFAKVFFLEKQTLLHILSVCLYFFRTYPSCKTLAPYCHLWPVLLYNIFHNISEEERFSEKVIVYKICFLRFSTKFVWKISHY